MSDFAPLPMSRPEAVADEHRLEALDSYHIMDTEPEEGFDEIVQLATIICQVPVALVSLVAGDRQWFKARIGFPRRETDLNSSVCAHALVEPDLLIIPDLTADPRTKDNPLVTEDPHIRFYAGAPLRNRHGFVLGSLCVIDNTPRPEGLTERQAEALRSLAGQVMTLLELRRAVVGRDTFIARQRMIEQRNDALHARLQISEAHWRGLFERLSEGFLVGEVVRDGAGKAADWRYLDVNEAWGELTGVEPATVIGRTIREVFPEIEEEWVQDFIQVAETGEPVTFTRQLGVLNRWYEGRAFLLEEDRFAALFTEVTDRVHAEVRHNALLEIGDHLRDLTTPAEMIAKASAITGKAIAASRVGFGQLDRDEEHVVIENDWTAPGVPSIAGQHRFEDYGDIRQELLLGEPLIIRDVLTDPRTAADPEAMLDLQIRALVNIPIQERGRTVAVFLAHDGKPRRWEQETVGFLRNVADRVATSVARLKAEADQHLLNQELSHRMKNMLAMVQAIAWQTLKGVGDQDAVQSFRNRIQALSTAHDLLLETKWSSTPLREIVESVLSRIGGMEHFTVSGPNVPFGPRATMSASLLLHELATNSAKYGALSAEAGRVFVDWSIDPATGELVFAWRESGGPPASEPTRLGFGSRLLRAGLIGTGGTSLRYLETGFEAQMRASIEQVQAS